VQWRSAAATQRQVWPVLLVDQNSEFINTIIKTTSVCDVTQGVPGGGRGWLAGDTDRLASWPVGVVDTRLAAATLSGRGAHVYTCTCVYDNIRYRRLPKYDGRRIPTHHKPSAGMPGPSGACTLGLAARGDGYWRHSSFLLKQQSKSIMQC